MDGGTVPGPKAAEEGSVGAAPPAPEKDTAHLHFHATTADYARILGYLSRRSVGSIAMSAFLLTDGLTLIVLGSVSGLVFAALGVAIFSGLLNVPFILIAIRRRADLLLTDIEVLGDATGVTMTTKLASSRQSWAFYRRSRETSAAFLLQPGTGATVFVLKRGSDPEQVAAFRRLLDAAGLRPRRTDLVRLAAAAALACVGALALSFGPRVVATLGANATISLATGINGRTISVQGTTDLPDGASVAVELIQLDEYDRAVAGGAKPTAETSPWVLYAYVTVQAGHFSASFPAPTWPAGRAVAIGYFWMDPDQPVEAIRRFGLDGASLKGPDVVSTRDRGPMLQVESNFTLP